MGTNTPLTWSVVIPVKVLALAKSRLADLADTDREAVVLAMAADTVAAAVACPAVGDVIVVSDDAAVRTEVEALGAEVIADGPGAGLNQALAAGAEHAAARWSGRGLAALTADLPALSARELTAALAAASAVSAGLRGRCGWLGDHAVHGDAGCRVQPAVRPAVAAEAPRGRGRRA